MHADKKVRAKLSYTPPPNWHEKVRAAFLKIAPELTRQAHSLSQKPSAVPRALHKALVKKFKRRKTIEVPDLGAITTAFAGWYRLEGERLMPTAPVRAFAERSMREKCATPTCNNKTDRAFCDSCRKNMSIREGEKDPNVPAFERRYPGKFVSYVNFRRY